MPSEKQDAYVSPMRVFVAKGSKAEKSVRSRMVSGAGEGA